MQKSLPYMSTKFVITFASKDNISKSLWLSLKIFACMYAGSAFTCGPFLSFLRFLPCDGWPILGALLGPQKCAGYLLTFIRTMGEKHVMIRD